MSMSSHNEHAHQIPDSPVGFTVIEPKSLREQILDGAAHDIAATAKVFEIINRDRPSRDRLLIAPVGEQLERLDDQLTPGALDTAETCLFRGEFSDHPFMVMSALSGPITAEELVRALDKSSRYGISPYSG